MLASATIETLAQHRHAIDPRRWLNQSADGQPERPGHRGHIRNAPDEARVPYRAI